LVFETSSGGLRLVMGNWDLQWVTWD